MLIFLLGAHIVPALAVGFGPGLGGQAYGGYSGLTSKGSPSLGYGGYAIGGGFGGGYASLPYAALSGGGIGGYGIGGYGGGIGGYGGGIGGYGIGGYGGGIRGYGGGIGGYGIGGYGEGIGGYGGGGLGALSALAVQSSSGLGALPLQSSSSAGFVAFEAGPQGPQGPQGPPPPPSHHGNHGKHGKHQQQEYVQPVQQYVQPVQEVLVEEYYQAEGPILENQVNSYDRETSYAVTHKPVFHKTVYNQITQHDRVNKEVLHHVSESEVRNFEVAGDQIYGGAMEVDHGEIGHAAYGAMIQPQLQAAVPVVQPQYQPFESASSSSGAMLVQPNYQPQAAVVQPQYQPFESASSSSGAMLVQPNYQPQAAVVQPQYQPFESASSSSSYQPQAAVVHAQYQPMVQPRAVVNQDVYHHVNVGTEVRQHTVAGSEQYGGATHVQHGNIGHDRYQNAVANTGAFNTVGSGSVVTPNYNPLGNVGGASYNTGMRNAGYPITDRG